MIEGRMMCSEPNVQQLPRLFLHPVTHDEGGVRQGFCGPAALSAVSGLTCEEVARRVRRVPGTIKGMACWELQASLSLLGYCAIETHYGELRWRPARPRFGFYPTKGQEEPYWHGRPTLARWLQDRDTSAFNSICILSIGGRRNGHFVTVQAGDVVDNNQGMVPIERSRYRRSQVNRAFRVVAR